MDGLGIIGLLLILVNFVISYRGFTNVLFFESYIFMVDPILVRKDYVRLLSSGFLHVSWTHLIFNMLSLYAFGIALENVLGPVHFLLVYFASLIGGGLFALLVHRNHGDYSAAGASGAVSGIIFASIALFPGLEIGFFGLPWSIPSWLFALLFVGFSIFGIHSGRGNIGHDAHLGGALVGMLLAICFQPAVLTLNYIPIFIVVLPTILFLILIINKPHLLYIGSVSFRKKEKYDNIDHKYNANKVQKQKEMDKLLDKINRNGLQSLSEKEKQRLRELSK